MTVTTSWVEERGVEEREAESLKGKFLIPTPPPFLRCYFQLVSIAFNSDGYMHTFVSDGGSSGSSSESEFEPGYVSKKRKKQKQKKGVNQELDSLSDYVRTTGRRKDVVSYKDYGSDEDGEGGGEELELEEGGEAQVAMVLEDNRETIEKILKKRIGRVGGECVCVSVCVHAQRSLCIQNQCVGFHVR